MRVTATHLVGILTFLIFCGVAIGGGLYYQDTQQEVNSLKAEIAALKEKTPEVVTRTIEKTGPAQGLLDCIKEAENEYNKNFGMVYDAKQAYLDNPSEYPNLTLQTFDANYAEVKSIQTQAEDKCYKIWK